MERSQRFALVAGLAVGLGFAGCRPSEEGEPATEIKSALTAPPQFAPYVTYPTGSRAEAVAIGDLDGDGRKDVAVTTSATGDAANDRMLNVFLQNVDGTLKPRVQYPLGSGLPRSLDIGDVTGDGRADAVVGSTDGAASRILVLAQNASGTLDAPVAYPTLNAEHVKVGDFNGDGRVDVAGLIAGTAGDGLDIFLQTAEGTLAAPVTYHVPHAGGEELDAGDVTGDGRTDLVVMSGANLALPASQTLLDITVLAQAADGTMAAPVAYAVPSDIEFGSVNIDITGIAIGDLTDDGRNDVVCSMGSGQTGAAIMGQTQQGGLAPVGWGHAIPGNAAAIALADVEGDAYSDIVQLHNNVPYLVLWRQTPGRIFAAYELYAIPSTSGYRPQALALGDINGDGLVDATIAAPTQGLVVLRHVSDASPKVTLTVPGTAYAGVPMDVTWTASADAASFTVSASFNGGGYYAPIPGCQGLPATARTCTWASPSPATTGVRLRIATVDAAGYTGASQAIVNLITPTLAITSQPQGVYVGSTLPITWTSNLPASNTMRIEVSRNGAAFETIVTAAPNTGSYTWTVTGPASYAQVRITSNGPPALSATSSPALFVLRQLPVLTVTSPTAGSTLFPGVTTVAWSSTEVSSATVNIEFSYDGGATFAPVVSGLPSAITGSVDVSLWTTTANAVIRVTAITTSLPPLTGVSAFSIIAPTLAVSSPVAAGTSYVGTPLTVAWSTNLPPSAKAFIELSRDGGTSYTALASVPNTGSFVWTAVGPDSTVARVRVTAFTPAGSYAVSTSGIFAIVTPALSVTSPVGGTAYTGTPLAIGWSSNLPPGTTARIELSRDGGATFETLADAAPNSGGFVWLAAGPDSAAARVRVTASVPGGSSVTSLSGPFAIVTPALSVTSPTGGIAYTGTPLAIGWSTNLPAGTVRVDVSRDGGATFETLADAAPNTGSFVWLAAGADSAAARVRVTASVPGGTASAVSGAFAIVTPALSITSPTGGTAYTGTALVIGWSSNLPADTVRVELTRDGGSTFELLADAAPNSGTFLWTVAGAETTSARVRVTATDPVGVAASSAPFAITAPRLSVTAPATGASWAIGTSRTIAWTSNLTDTVRVEVSRNGGASYTTVSAGAPATGSLVWTVVGPATTSAVVRVSSNGVVPAVGTSALFTIGNPTASVTSPGTGASWTIGAPQTITWASNLPPGATVRIQLSRNGGTTYTDLTTSAPNSGSFAWTPTGATTTTARIRVTINGSPTATATSGQFTLAAATLKVTAPNTTTTWTIGSSRTVTWTHNVGTAANFKIEVSRNGGASWSVIAAAAPSGGASTGSYAWTVTGPASTTARIRVTWNGNPTVSDTSDVSFRIQ